jgi:hypothetical protein
MVKKMIFLAADNQDLLKGRNGCRKNKDGSTPSAVA